MCKRTVELAWICALRYKALYVDHVQPALRLCLSVLNLLSPNKLPDFHEIRSRSSLKGLVEQE